MQYARKLLNIYKCIFTHAHNQILELRVELQCIVTKSEVTFPRNEETETCLVLLIVFS